MFDKKDDKDKIQVKTSDETLRGLYANSMQVQHSKEEFVIDFMNIFPPVGNLQARVIVTPPHLKRLIDALVENLNRYEANWGKVESAQEPLKKDE